MYDISTWKEPYPKMLLKINLSRYQRLSHVSYPEPKWEAEWEPGKRLVISSLKKWKTKVQTWKSAQEIYKSNQAAEKGQANSSWKPTKTSRKKYSIWSSNTSLNNIEVTNIPILPNLR